MKEYDVRSISGLFANKILNNDNQHVTMLTVGTTGKGKSWSNLEIGHQLGCKFAETLGGDWTDYFNYETNIVIADLKEALSAIKQMKKTHQITLFDDIGIGWNAREWNSVGNKALNAILQVFRTKQNVLLITLPDQFLIDKVPRRLVHYYMEVVTSMHQQGISLGKFFKVVSRPRESRPFHTYLKDGKREFERHKFTRNIPAELIEWYEPRRDQATDMIMDAQIEAVMDAELKKAQKRLDQNNTFDKEAHIVEVVNTLHARTGAPKEECCENVGVAPTTFYRWQKQLQGDIS